MLSSIITFLVYAFIGFAIADIVLYILVKIKQKKIQKQIENSIPPVIDAEIKDITDLNKKS